MLADQPVGRAGRPWRWSVRRAAANPVGVAFMTSHRAVRIGGQDDSGRDARLARSAIGWYPKMLFSGTIGANIAYGRRMRRPNGLPRRPGRRREFVNLCGRVSDGRRYARTTRPAGHGIALAGAAPAAVVDAWTTDLCRGCGHRMRNSGGAAGGDRGSHRDVSPAADPCLPWPTGSRSSRLSGAPARCRHRGVFGAHIPAIGNCCRPRFSR